MTTQQLDLSKNIFQRENLVQVEKEYANAIRLTPQDPQLHYALAMVYFRGCQYQKTVSAANRAVELNPDFADALLLLGVAQILLGNFGNYLAAEPYFRKVIALQPERAEAYINLGICLSNLRRYDEAFLIYQKAVAVEPNNAVANNNVGAMLLGFSRVKEAQSYFEKAARSKPDYVEAQSNLAYCLILQGQTPEQAVANFAAALGVRNLGPVYSRIGSAFLRTSQHTLARQCFSKHLQAEPKSKAARLNLGMIDFTLGNLEEANQQIESVLKDDPASPSARCHRGFIRLMRGEMPSGWDDYAWVSEWKKENRAWSTLGAPEWDGSPFRGKTLILYPVEGLGDSIQWARYLPMVKERGGTVALICQAELFDLFKGLRGVDILIRRGDPLPKFDLQVTSHLLPKIFRTRLETIPNEVPYLHGNYELNPDARRALESTNKFKIGMVWQGNPKHGNDRNRSLALQDFRALAGVSGIKLFSLQKNHGTEQIKTLHEELGLTDLGRTFKSFADTAAVIQNLDLVISVDTSVAHVAGALGRPTWLLLPTLAEWRWMLEREDSPWYPTMRLFRRKPTENWEELIGRMAQEIKKLS